VSMPTWLTLYSLSLDFLVIIDLGTGRTTDTALYDQRPNVPRHRSKNLEQ